MCIRDSVWAGAGGLYRGAGAMSAFLAAAIFWGDSAVGQYLMGISFFILGSLLSKQDFRNRLLEAAIPQWLGRVSYSLYLSHWLVFAIAIRISGPWGAIEAIPVAFCVGALVWRFVEMPSIMASRRISRVFDGVAVRFGSRSILDRA